MTGVGLSEFGNKVICLDINQSKINDLSAGKVPIHEPGLEDLIRKNVKSERLFFSSDMASSIKKSEVINHGGYSEGSIDIHGLGQFEEDTFRLWFKNEHLISWKNEKPFITCPDLLTVMDPIQAMAVSNPDCKEGDEVYVLGWKSDLIWRTQRGIDLLSPKSFGVEIDFKPIEEFLKS